MSDKQWYVVTVVLGVVAPHETLLSFHHVGSVAEAVGEAILSLLATGPRSIRTMAACPVPVDIMVSPKYVTDEVIRASVKGYIRDNLRISAIKKVREMTQWGLKEAKAWIDKEFPYPTGRTDLT